MTALQATGYFFSGISGALFLGFAAAANSNMIAIHVLASVIIAMGFTMLGLYHSRGQYYYRGISPILLNFLLCGLAMLVLYWAFIGVGGWLYTPSEIQDAPAYVQ
jgi:hypothetical protein